MRGTIITVQLMPSRDAIAIEVRIPRPTFPRDYDNPEQASKYLKAVKEWLSIHTGGINFDYQEILV